MRKFIWLLIVISGLMQMSVTYTFAWGKYSGNPERILTEIAAEANDETRIQETAIDDISDTQGAYPGQFRVANILDALRQQIGPYLDWMFYIGLAIATILLVYNGLLLVTHSVHGKGDLSSVTKNLMNIGVGVILLVGVYSIIKILNGILTRVLG